MLPKYIDPFKLIAQGAEIKGQLPLQQMSRLSELLQESSGRVDVVLKFKVVEGQKIIHEQISADLSLTCQRCGQPMVYEMRIATELVPVVTDEQAEQVLKRYDPLVTSGESVNLNEMIENELLLNFPMIPKHKEGECQIELPENINFK